MNEERTEIVRAAPERKRILRYLLNIPEEKWTAYQRNLYRDMCRQEWLADGKAYLDDIIQQQLDRESFLLGVQLPQYREPTRGERERNRRKTRREAVTALDARRAVTTGVLTNCIICGKALWQGLRRDSVYCSPACRQKAYRTRRRTS